MALELRKNDLLHKALQDVAFGLPATSGQAFFEQLVEHLAQTFNAAYAFIGLLDKKSYVPTVETVAAFAHDALTDNFRYLLADAPCENVVGKTICAHPNNIQTEFPNDPLLARMNVESYIGAPLFNAAGDACGLVVVMDTAAMRDVELKTELLEVYTLRAARELERLRSERALHQSEARFRTLVGNIPGVIYRCTQDKDRTLEYASDAITTLTGYDVDKFTVNRELAYNDIIHPDDRQLVVDNIQKAVRQRVPYVLEYRIIDAAGAVHWVHEKGQAQFDDQNKVEWLDGAIFDISERKQAEKEIFAYRNHLEELVEQRTQELQGANQELESFAYSISHDLRSPLRAMHGFSKALQEDYADALDATANSYLDKICAASERMADLIDDLLRLTRISRRDMDHAPVDLSLLTREVAASIQAQHPAESVHFDIEPGIIVMGDHHLIRIALENLVQNAWKYTRGKPQRIIEFGAAISNQQTRYYLRDNGVGFDMRYADKLFGVFERLHGGEFEGTGIGLATVKRVVNRHNGEVWGESEPGKGACFYFTL